MKPAGWPRYMIEKRLKGGATAYYWNVPNRDIVAGFTIGREALGPSYAEAIARAHTLNAHLDAWRDGRGAEKIDEAQPGYGTLGWLFEQYRRHPLFEKKVSARAKGGYERALRAIEDMQTKLGHTAAHLPLTSITRRAVYLIYNKLLGQGPRKADRATQAGYAINIARRAWNIIQPEHPKIVPTDNPWAKVERMGRKGTKPAATRVEAYTLAKALKEIGEPHLGAAALIAFEWHQRPENMLAGSITWHDYRGADHPGHVRIVHKKNGEEVMLPLEDGDGQLFYPELEAYLAELPRLGFPIVLTSGERGPSRPYSMVYAQRRVRQPAGVPGLELTLRWTPAVTVA